MGSVRGPFKTRRCTAFAVELPAHDPCVNENCLRMCAATISSIIRYSFQPQCCCLLLHFSCVYLLTYFRLLFWNKYVYGTNLNTIYPDLKIGSVSKAMLSLNSGSNEKTLALTNLNLDFSLVKVDPPTEYTLLVSALSSSRRDTTEEGSLHRTARR